MPVIKAYRCSMCEKRLRDLRKAIKLLKQNILITSNTPIELFYNEILIELLNTLESIEHNKLRSINNGN